MEQLEKEFLKKLSKLTHEKLLEWISGHYTGISYNPRAPFASSYDPMDIVERVLGLLNKSMINKEYSSLLINYENCLIYLFNQEANHPYFNPSLIYKFLTIFINCPPKGYRSENLLVVILPILSQKRWKNIHVGARNLHYENLELAVTLRQGLNDKFLNNKYLDQYLNENLIIENNPRFCNIVLNYYNDTYKIQEFFRTFDKSFDILQADKVKYITDSLLLLLLKNESISIKYFTNWIVSKQVYARQMKKNVASIISLKLDNLFKDEKILKFIIDKFDSNPEIYVSINREEGRYIFALITYITTNYFPKKISPNMVKLFFENEQYFGFSLILSDKLRLLNTDTQEEIFNSLIENNVNYDEYYSIHILTLLRLYILHIGETDNFSLQENEMDIFIDFNEDALEIENFEYQSLFNTYKWKESHDQTASVLTVVIPSTYSWWQVFDQSFAFSSEYSN